MRPRPVVALLVLTMAMILAPPATARQKPITGDEAQGMVRTDLGGLRTLMED
jgi:hypothetical protein